MATTQQQAQHQQHSTAINAAISKLQELGINFLALDFDQTILDVHTRGRWNGTLEELVPHVRPVFAQLIQAALANGLHVAIVTFTTQIKFVRGVLEAIIPAHADKIPIRGSDRSWSYNGEGSQDGKQPYMASAVEELEHRSNDIRISKQTTVLIDDDARNIRYALADGTRAVWFNPDKPHLLLQDLIKLV